MVRVPAQCRFSATGTLSVPQGDLLDNPAPRLRIQGVRVMEPVQAIDVHAHYGVCKVVTISQLQQDFYSGDETVVLDRARKANTCLTIVSPLEALMPRHNADPVSGNRHAAEVVERCPDFASGWSSTRSSPRPSSRPMIC